jgi:hypothetical protein
MKAGAGMGHCFSIFHLRVRLRFLAWVDESKEVEQPSRKEIEMARSTGKKALVLCLGWLLVCLPLTGCSGGGGMEGCERNCDDAYASCMERARTSSQQIQCQQSRQWCVADCFPDTLSMFDPVSEMNFPIEGTSYESEPRTCPEHDGSASLPR